MQKILRIFWATALILASVTSVCAEEQSKILAPQDPQHALKIQKSDVCQFHKLRRTSSMWLTNETALLVEIAFFQSVSTNPPPNTDFAIDSGVFVASTGLGTGQTITVDPCYAGGSPKPVQANICKASVRMEDGQEPQLEDQNSAPSPYWNDCGWKLIYSPADEQGRKRIIMKRSAAQPLDQSSIPTMK